MKKYEYEIIALDKNEEIKEQLNKLGYKGWDLCAYNFILDIGYFKREIKLSLELTTEDGKKELLTIR